MDEAFNWAQLGTVAGVATAVTLLTQTLKRFVPRVDPKWIALGLSLIISLTHMIAFLGIRIETAVLTLLNAVVAAGAAIGFAPDENKPASPRRYGQVGWLDVLYRFTF